MKKNREKLFNLIFADFCPILASLTPEMMLHTLSASMINQESNSVVITLPLTLKLSLVSTLANRHIEKKKNGKKFFPGILLNFYLLIIKQERITVYDMYLANPKKQVLDPQVEHQIAISVN